MDMWHVTCDMLTFAIIFSLTGDMPPGYNILIMLKYIPDVLTTTYILTFAIIFWVRQTDFILKINMAKIWKLAWTLTARERKFLKYIVVKSNTSSAKFQRHEQIKYCIL